MVSGSICSAVVLTDVAFLLALHLSEPYSRGACAHQSLLSALLPTRIGSFLKCWLFSAAGLAFAVVSVAAFAAVCLVAFLYQTELLRNWRHLRYGCLHS